MAMIVCNECQKEISDTAKACPNCGAEVPRAKVWPWVIGIPVALFIVFLIFGATRANTPEGQAKSKARDAISYCWKQQRDQSLSSGSQQFVASTCKKMEQDFRDRYGVSP